MKIVDYQPMDIAEVISVIRTTIRRRGKGIDGDPVRIITEYWTTDGKFLCEVDPYSGATK